MESTEISHRFPCQSGTFVVADKASRTRHHPKSIVYIGVHFATSLSFPTYSCVLFVFPIYAGIDLSIFRYIYFFSEPFISSRHPDSSPLTL